MGIGYHVKRLLRHAGIDIRRFEPAYHPLARRKQLLASYAIDMVLDVGANTGQFARQLRRDIAYNGRIVSFEPLGSAFRSLEAAAKRDPAWEVRHCALGDADTSAEINVAENSYSSSLLPILPSHVFSSPRSRYVGTETITVRRLDALFPGLCHGASNIYMKVDTQGYESRVLKGAEESLGRIGTVELEMSLVPLYDGELLFHDMVRFMESKGYALASIEDEFTDPSTGRLLQVDGIFHRY